MRGSHAHPSNQQRRRQGAGLLGAISSLAHHHAPPAPGVAGQGVWQAAGRRSGGSLQRPALEAQTAAGSRAGCCGGPTSPARGRGSRAGKGGRTAPARPGQRRLQSGGRLKRLPVPPRAQLRHVARRGNARAPVRTCWRGSRRRCGLRACTTGWPALWRVCADCGGERRGHGAGTHPPRSSLSPGSACCACCAPHPLLERRLLGGITAVAAQRSGPRHGRDPSASSRCAQQPGQGHRLRPPLWLSSAQSNADRRRLAAGGPAAAPCRPPSPAAAPCRLPSPAAVEGRCLRGASRGIYFR